MEHLLRLASEIGARRFVQISTAFVAGQDGGIVEAVPVDLQQPFNNVYERTKAIGEQIILEQAPAVGIQPIVLRPPLVVGPWDSKASGGSATGIYGLVRQLLAARSAIEDAAEPVRLEGSLEGTIDLVPVDRLVHAMWRLRASGFPSGPIVHLTSGQETPAKAIFETACSRAKVTNLRVAPPPHAGRTALERRLSRRFSFYCSYGTPARRFVPTVAIEPTITPLDLLNYMEAAVREVHHGVLGTDLTPETIETWDGARLNVWVGGDPDAHRWCA